mmetsp:Transcript_12730/g.28139  ORF Transcript_12730/g.28139 Transcript_12730/m.28139 type:complete len:106 (-) Transcript_12730:120-437(-)
MESQIFGNRWSRELGEREASLHRRNCERPLSTQRAPPKCFAGMVGQRTDLDGGPLASRSIQPLEAFTGPELGTKECSAKVLVRRLKGDLPPSSAAGVQGPCLLPS